MVKGKCYCGKVRFEVSGDIRKVRYCHCGQCRKMMGHYMAASAAPMDKVEIKGNVTWFESSPGHKRGFCATCGTPLFWKADSRETLSIVAGAFDAGTKLEAERHIFVDEKVDYYQICDGLPQFTGRDCPKGTDI